MRDWADDAAVKGVVVRAIAQRQLQRRHRPWVVKVGGLGLPARRCRRMRPRRRLRLLHRMPPQLLCSSLQCLLRTPRPCAGVDPLHVETAIQFTAYPFMFARPA